MLSVLTMSDQPILTFVTTTTYGSWLPGDARGYVDRGRILPASPELERHARASMKQRTVVFSPPDQQTLLVALLLACDAFNYQLLDLSIEPWHLHWIVRHDDPVKSMVGRLKNRMRQALDRGRIWTAGYCHRVIESEDALLAARAYIRNHPGCRVSDGKRLGAGGEQSPGKAGG